MDMNMPEMDGYEATRLLRDCGYRQPILALTANAMSGDSDRCLTAGCNAYMAKPIDRARLIQTILALTRPHTADGLDIPASSVDSPSRGDETIVSQFIGDPEMAEILREFVGRLPGQLEAMRQAMDGNRYDELRRLAHMLKGPAAPTAIPY